MNRSRFSVARPFVLARDRGLAACLDEARARFLSALRISVIKSVEFRPRDGYHPSARTHDLPIGSCVKTSSFTVLVIARGVIRLPQARISVRARDAPVATAQTFEHQMYHQGT
jgi:hypothetical protein